ncbi:MAG: PAS domain S-box protein [Thermodesulfobacteriota bacterium]
METKPTYEELEQLAEIFSMTLDMICIADIHSARFLQINEAFSRVLGYSKSELLERSFLDFVHPEDIEATVGILEDKLKKGEKVLHFTNRYRCKDGRYVWLDWLSHPDTSKGITYAIAHDVTDRIQTEKALLESQRRLQDLVDFYPDATLAIDAEKRVILWNRAIEAMTGIPASEMIGKGDHAYTIPFYGKPREQLMDLIWVDDKRIEAHYPTIVREGRTLIAEAFCNALYNNRGAWIWAKASPLYDREGKIIGAIETIRDITKIKEAETSLQESERLFRTVFQHAPVGMAVIDIDRRFLQVNDAICSILGYPAEELIGRSFNAFTHPEDREDGRIRWAEMLSGQSVTTQGEKRYIHRSGRIIWTIAQNALFTRSDGVPMYVVSHLIDITSWKQAEEARQKLEEQLHQAQRLESIGRLAGGVAHDFNNKLQAILGFTQMALDEAGQDTVLRKRLLAIQNAAEGSANLTRQLLAFARKQTVSPKVVNLNEVISGMIAMIKRLIGENIHLDWIPADDLWFIRIDPSQIDQVLVNLCINGRDAIEGQSGSIAIETQNISLDETYCRYHEGFFAGDYVLMTVSDSGCGMKPELLEHIFEPFFTTKEQGKGTGLGLATVYGIVRQNNGMIHVYSEPGKGSTFRVYFPRTGERGQSVSTMNAVGHFRGKETILIVEDDPAILEVSKEVLGRAGYTVLAADGPEEALRQARSYPEAIHLLITDVIMPRMNGRQLSILVQETHPAIQSIYMSGYTSNIIAHHGILDEGLFFIQKPFSITTLLEKVRTVLDQAGGKV